MAEDQIVELVQTKIYSIRNQKVMLDRDIAELYGVETKRVNEAVRNNADKFPEDFYFELDVNEQDLLRSKLSTFPRCFPFQFPDNYFVLNYFDNSQIKM
ncbi:MAG: ORF6N domain-containing protein [Deltaproteobacteria bacterium]|nr:ORF6N domain-containing protein [Deltaproteobacteria bacterium]